MTFAQFMNEVRKDRYDAMVGAVRAAVRRMNLGVEDAFGYRTFEDDDVITLLNAMPKKPVPENKRLDLVKEVDNGKRLAWACYISYWSLMKMVREGSAPSLKINDRYYFTKEMALWLWSHQKGAQSMREMQWVQKKSGVYESIEQWRTTV